jgi:hypothetical protein
MGALPTIRTAVPQRRYRLGEYDVTLLGDVDSGDGIDYQYIMAFVAEGAARPSLFVCSERNPPGERAQGSHRIRVASEGLSEEMGADDRWRNLDMFADEALRIGTQILALGSEQPLRLM